jgi:hypothetical protein
MEGLTYVMFKLSGMALDWNRDVSYDTLMDEIQIGLSIIVLKVLKPFNRILGCPFSLI